MTSPDLFSWLRGELAESVEWIRDWRDGQFDSGSRDAQGWPIEMHGVVADLERYERLWPLALDVIEAATGDEACPICLGWHGCEMDCPLAAFLWAAERERGGA